MKEEKKPSPTTPSEKPLDPDTVREMLKKVLAKPLPPLPDSLNFKLRQHPPLS